MHQKYMNGSVSLENGIVNWYDNYVHYAKLNYIINQDYNWNRWATRAGYVEIFSQALPDKAFQIKNTISSNAIPDIAASHPQAESIYKLYRAGVLTGIDEKGNFLQVGGIGEIVGDEAGGRYLARRAIRKTFDYYFRFGEGAKTLVILPGLSVQSVMGSADAVAAAYECFAAEYTVYLFDRRSDLPAKYPLADMADHRDFRTGERVRVLGAVYASRVELVHYLRLRHLDEAERREELRRERDYQRRQRQ